jgi:hypothetical protein
MQKTGNDDDMQVRRITSFLLGRERERERERGREGEREREREREGGRKREREREREAAKSGKLFWTPSLMSRVSNS